MEREEELKKEIKLLKANYSKWAEVSFSFYEKYKLNYSTSKDYRRSIKERITEKKAELKGIQETKKEFLKLIDEIITECDQIVSTTPQQVQNRMVGLKKSLSTKKSLNTDSNPNK